MNWTLIFKLSLFGAAIGVASLFGLTHGVEWVLWLAIALMSAFLLSKAVTSRLFLSGLLVGVFDAIANSLIQFLFYSTYLANNPGAAEMLSRGPAPVDPRFFFLIAGPFVGVIYGMVVGFFSYIGGKVMQSKTATDPAGNAHAG